MKRPALIAFLTLLAIPLHAADVSDLKYTTTDGKVTIIECGEAVTGNLLIPDTIKGNPVTSIGRGVFNSRNSLTSVTFLGDAPKEGKELAIWLNSQEQLFACDVPNNFCGSIPRKIASLIAISTSSSAQY